MIAGAVRDAQGRAWAEGYQAGYDTATARGRDHSPMLNPTPPNPYKAGETR